MKYLAASILNDLNSLREVAESAFSTTDDSSLEEWFSFEQMVKMVAQGRGTCIKAVNEAKKQGAAKMFVYTNKDDAEVVSFYKKNGYDEAGWIRDYQYGENNSAVFLLKHL